MTSAACHSGQHPPTLAERNLCLIAGVRTGGSSFATQIKNRGALVASQVDCAALLDTGSPHAFINTRVFETIKLTGSALPLAESRTPSRRGVFQTSAAIRLGLTLFRDDQLAVSITVWAYVVPSEAMQDAVVLGRPVRGPARCYGT